jgi:gluconokinase
MNKENSPQYIIGIDIGTGSTKALALNYQGEIIANSQTFYPTQSLQIGYSEQDPEVIWNAFAECLKKIVQTLNCPPVSICFSSAMHGLMVVNKDNTPTTPLITWADIRSQEIATRIRKLSSARSIYKATGTPIHSMTPLCKIIWIKENEPVIFKNAHKFISIKEYIWFKLFGKYQIDHSIASATGLFSIKDKKWNKASLELCHIDSSKLSEPVDTNFICNNLNPSVAESLTIPSTTSFCIGASDGCLANVGSYATEPGTAALTIGTSGAVRIAGKKPVFNFKAMSFNYVLDGKTYIAGGPVNNGGNIIDWLFQTFLSIADPSEDDYKKMFQSIREIPAGSKGLLFLPYLNGERAPIWDERSSGVFFGIKPFHVKEWFLRAGVEGVCYSMNHVLKMVESSTRNIVQLNVGGGFVNSEVWLHILASITGKNICVIETEDSSAIGAALLNMKALKIIESYSSLKPVNPSTIKPDMIDHKLYNEYFSVFKSLYKPLKHPMHKVYEINN